MEGTQPSLALLLRTLAVAHPASPQILAHHEVQSAPLEREGGGYHGLIDMYMGLAVLIHETYLLMAHRTVQDGHCQLPDRPMRGSSA